MEKGKLYLLPTPLAEEDQGVIPMYVKEIIHSLNFFITEKAKTGRRYIKSTQHPKPISELRFVELNKRIDYSEWSQYLAAADKGQNIGLLSEAGCPGVADPGAEVVKLAHQKGIEVVPLVGPSSILLALMGSGMNGQSFVFHGYLSPKRESVGKDLKRLEQAANKYKQTQIFIETPYRNTQLVEQALKVLSPRTAFCIAMDLTSPNQLIVSKKIEEWRRIKLPDLHKRPAVFLLF